MTSTQPARRATAADIARAVGVSRATVGYVLNGTPGQTISEATRQRVLTEARRLDYRPHRAARALASGQSHLVLLVLPDWPIDYSMRVNLDEASLVLDEAGYTLVTTTSHQSGRAQPLWETLNPDVVMGMLPFSEETLERMRAQGVERIVPNTPLSAPAIDPGATGFAEGPRRQVEHLLERGKTRLAFAGSRDPRIVELVSDRRALTRRTVHEITGGSLAGDSDVDAGDVVDVLSQWRQNGVDGIVAYNDDIAALLVGTALRAGIQLPTQLAVIGHDDSPIAGLFVPALSSIRVDSAGLGRYLAELALAEIHGRDAPAAGPAGNATIVVRETT